MRRLLFLLVVAVLVPLPAVAAELETSAEVTPSLWLGDQIFISSNCTPPGNFTVSGVTASVTGPLVPPDFTLSHAGGDTYEGSWEPPVEGEYSVSLFCVAEDGNSTINQSLGPLGFTVSRLNLGLEGTYPEILYTDSESLEIYANLTRISASVEQVSDTNAVEWEVLLGGEDMGPDSVLYDPESSYWILKSSPGDPESGSRTLEIKASIDGESVSLGSSIEIRESLVFEILSVKPENPKGDEEVTVEIRSEYRDSDIFSEASFSLRVGTESVEDFLKDSGSNTVSFTLPELDPGTYGLKITLSREGIPDTTVTRDITRTVPISGSIKDADGNSMKGRITLIRDGDEEEMTLSRGGYSVRIVPGDYNVILENSEELKSAFFSGMYIDEDPGDLFRFDSLSDRLGVEGIKVASAFALETGCFFSSLVMQVRYDASGIRKEETLEVYTCEQWNFDARVCNSGWKKEEGIVDPVMNTMEVEVDHLSAFLIGEKEDMILEISLDKEEYYLGEDMRVVGTVRTEGGNPIADAYVTFYLGGVEKTGRTNSHGVFSEMLIAPDVPGEYELSAESNISSLNPIEESEAFSVKEKKEISILLPMEAEIIKGTDNTMSVSILNSGQCDLNNLELEISGVPEGWLYYSPDSWDTLPPGEEERAELVIHPEDPEDTLYMLEIKAESDEINGSETMPIVLKNGTGTASENPGATPQFPDFFTSNIILDANDILNAVSVVLAFVVLFAVVFTSKKKGKKFEANPRMEKMISGIKKEIMKGRKSRKTRKPGKKSGKKRK